jgi:hypothetical protein
VTESAARLVESRVMSPAPRLMKTAAAREYLGICATTLAACDLNLLPHEKYTGRTFGRRPFMFRTEHIHRVRELMDATGNSVRACVRFVAAEIEGRI